MLLIQISFDMFYLSRNVGGTSCVFKARVVSDIFEQNLRIFGLNQLQIFFLLLQDLIFKIFVPEIK